MNVHFPIVGEWLRKPYVAFVEDALPASSCEALVRRIESERPAVAPINAGGRVVMNLRVRDNERVMFEDNPLAAELFARTRAVLPAALHGGVLAGYNERFRGYRYQNGQRFAPHFDGAYFRPDGGAEREGSQITLLFYLNEGFTGGETNLIDYEVVIRPRLGSLLAFEHALLHEGAPVTDGIKYVLRTDAMYRFVG